MASRALMSCPTLNCTRHRNSMLVTMPWRRQIAAPDAPGCSASRTIASFSSSVNKRRFDRPSGFGSAAGGLVKGSRAKERLAAQLNSLLNFGAGRALDGAFGASPTPPDRPRAACASAAGCRPIGGGPAHTRLLSPRSITALRRASTRRLSAPSSGPSLCGSGAARAAFWRARPAKHQLPPAPLPSGERCSAIGGVHGTTPLRRRRCWVEPRCGSTGRSAVPCCRRPISATCRDIPAEFFRSYDVVRGEEENRRATTDAYRCADRIAR